MKDNPRDYIKELRANCKDAMAHGQQIDFFDALAISRPTGEQAVWWMLPKIRDLEFKNYALRAALVEIHDAVSAATSYPETVKHVHDVIDKVINL